MSGFCTQFTVYLSYRNKWRLLNTPTNFKNFLCLSPIRGLAVHRVSMSFNVDTTGRQAEDFY